MRLPSSIYAINRLDDPEKRRIYSQLIPPELIARFNIEPSFQDAYGRDLLHLNCPPGSPSAEMALYHQAGFPDPVLYGHIADTLLGQVQVLLYLLNNPDSPRFAIDCLPDGTPTRFGTLFRNLGAEQAALQYGLAPGQIRDGLRMLGPAVRAFDGFIDGLGLELYFAEPLYYHNAIFFERNGFSYEKGRRLMERIHAGFSPGGDLLACLDSSTPFRSPLAAGSIRLRSWAIHDNLMGIPFTGVTMYKRIGKMAQIDTCPGIDW